MKNNNLLAGLFKANSEAGKAYNALLKLGYSKDEIHVLMPEKTRKKHGYERHHPYLTIEDEAIEGAGIGGAVGVYVGSITGALIALGIFTVISKFNIDLAEPIALWLGAAAGGGIAGGLVGALINIAISTHHAHHFKSELEKNAILILLIIHSKEDLNKLEIEWNNYNGIILNS